jgi:hypothetical protein
MKRLAIFLLLLLSACATTPADRAVQAPGAPRQPPRNILTQIIAYPLGIAIYPLFLLWRANDPAEDPSNPLGPSLTIAPSAPGSPGHMAPSSASQLSPAREIQFMDIYDRHSNRIGWGRQGRDGSWEFFNRDGSRLGTVIPRR